MSDNARRGWALVLFALLVAADIVYVVAQRQLTGYHTPYGVDDVHIGEVLGGLLTGTLGLVLAWLRPRNPIGWLIVLAGLLLMLCDAGQAYGTLALVDPEKNLPLGELALSLSAPLWIGTVFIPASLVLVRYPSGTIAGRWARRFERLVIIGFALAYVGYATSPNSVTDEVPGHRPPVQLPDVVSGVMLLPGALIVAVGTLLIIGDAVRRAVRSDRQERAALLWLLVSATFAVLVIYFSPSDSLGTQAYALVLAAIAIGVLRYQALGIDLVVRRALLYAMLTGLVLLVFVGITAGLAALIPTGPFPQVIAAVLIAVGLTPARDRIQALVDRMLYGDRGDPSVTLRRLGSSMGAAPSEGLLLAVVANLAESLRLDGAEVLREDGTPVATWGTPTDGQRIALSFAGEPLGELRVGRRSGESRLGRADRQLIDTVTPLIAAVVHAVRLTDELRDERNRVVEATEIERRRLRQELHDGLGPSLTGVGLGLEAAAARPLADDPETAELLARLRSEVAASLEETRRIIDALRPGSLERSDLASALRRRLQSVADAGVEARLDAPEQLPDLPADVETALLRIADEALTNVVRHASAGVCNVSLRADGRAVHLEVRDDGVGLGNSPERGSGVGLGSMRERAERLGGTLVLSSEGARGTVVRTDIPLSHADPSLTLSEPTPETTS